MKPVNSQPQHQLARHDITFRQSGTYSSCLDRYIIQIQPDLSHLIPAQQLPLTPNKTPHTQSFKGKYGPTPHFKLDIPADLLVGVYRAAVYTTKIMLVLARVSKHQSQPFMVRVQIYIAESGAGGQVSSHSTEHLWVQCCQ